MSFDWTLSWREEIWREVLCWCPEQRLSSKWLQWLLLRTAESGADPEKSLRIVLVLLVFPKIWIVLSLSDPQNQSTKINFKSTKYSFRFQQLAYSSYLPPQITNGETLIHKNWDTRHRKMPNTPAWLISYSFTLSLSFSCWHKVFLEIFFKDFFWVFYWGLFLFLVIR